ncbi:MAG TPA: efflux transporter outer membrane subunit [Blastocatellia bacterium]|nr:efflux transporter outer membrane subunit [Blastocatellia bacterium]
MSRRLILVLIIASLMTACTMGPKYQRPKVQTPSVYRGVADPSAQPDPQTLADTKWFDVFSDEKLRELIRTALVSNYDLREAVARIDEARANYGITRADQFPTIDGSGDITTERISRGGSIRLPEVVKRDRTFGSVLLNLLTFEVDVWGRLRKATEAARADLLASEETRKAVVITLVSDVATAYFNLRELDFELEIAKRTLTSRLESLRIIKLRQERGVSNMLEVRQAEELVYSATEVIPAKEQAIEQQENFLSFLLARNPAAVERGSSLTEQQMPPRVPPGLASELIERRPDIRAAEQNLVSANALIGVAKAAYFPRITLTGFLGFESAQLSNLFSNSRSVWAFVPQVTQPIFTAGRLKSNVRFSQAQRDIFLINYERTIQNAFREVSDSLIAYRKVKEVRGQRELLVQTLTDRSRLAYMRYTGGVSNLLEALDADRNLFDAELSLAQSRRDELLSVVQLYKALGGGWQQ